MKIRKKYVSVDAHFDECGAIYPVRIIWDDGRIFEVDRVLDIREAASRKAGGQGIRYLCRIRGCETCVYYEKPRWFVEEKVRD